MKPFFRTTQIVMLFLFLAMPAFAGEGADYGVEVSRKLGRGLGNVLSSVAEIPCAFRDEVVASGSAGLVTGLFKSVALFARRLLVGVTEVGTFMIPMEETLKPVCTKPPAPAIQAQTL